MMSNKKLGNALEKQVAEYLADNGYWVHLLQQNKSGQPADLIAVNMKGVAFLIDCKACTTQGFKISRVEENQHLAMKKFYEKTGLYGWFAIGVKNVTYMMPYLDVYALNKEGVDKVSQPALKQNLAPLKQWAEIYVDYSK